MGPQLVIYATLYVITVAAAIGVLVNRDTVKSAMCLVLVMLSLAAHYFYLGMEFVGAIQIIVYAGAIMVLFLFVIMLLNVREREIIPWYLRKARWLGAALAAFIFVILVASTRYFAPEVDASAGIVARPAPSIEEIVTLLITKFSLPFLLTSILLLVAVIGAVVMGRREDPETGEEYIPDDMEEAV